MHPFKVYDSMVFQTYSQIYATITIQNIFISKRNPISLSCHLPSLPFPAPQFYAAAAAAAKLHQSCPTLCDSVDGSPPGSSVPGILRARILEWVAISFSNACMLSRFSRVRLCATPQTAALQAPLSLGFSRQEHWSGLPFPSPNLFLLTCISKI